MERTNACPEEETSLTNSRCLNSLCLWSSEGSHAVVGGLRHAHSWRCCCFIVARAMARSLPPDTWAAPELHWTGLDLSRDRPASSRAEHLLEMGRSVCFSGWAESRMQDAVTFLYFGFWWLYFCVYLPLVPPALIHSFIRNVRILSFSLNRTFVL